MLKAQLAIGILALVGCGGSETGTDVDARPDAYENWDDGMPDAPIDGALGAPPCEGDDTQHLRCDYETASFSTGAFGLDARDVHYMVPTGTPPAAGWPVVLLFQGSLFSAERSWEADVTDTFGALAQTRLVRDFLAAGFAVITPETALNGSTFWDTNTVGCAALWESCTDRYYMDDLFQAIDLGDFGPLETSRMLAAGISSGGYMSSRMGVRYPERVSVIAVHSASYMTCSGALCSVPDPLPANHPPTLIVHGEADNVAPYDQALEYRDALVRDGITVEVTTDVETGHAWLTTAPQAIVPFAQAHR